MAASYLSYSGKARPLPGAAHPWHPLACHSLDVAAVGAALLEADAGLAEQLGRVIGLGSGESGRWLIWFLAPHDLGKFSADFQAQVPEPFERSHGRTDTPRRYSHGEAAMAFWNTYLTAAGILPTWVRRRAVRKPGAVLTAWFHAVAGHHGEPIEAPRMADGLFNEIDRAAALAFHEEARTLLLEPPLGIPEGAAARGTWLVAGLAVLCDWIGSRQRWSPYRPPEEAASLAEYWRGWALPRARTALIEAGVVPAKGSGVKPIAALLPHLATSEPTPLQALAHGVDLDDGPRLFPLENMTGSGKTEAALILAQPDD